MFKSVHQVYVKLESEFLVRDLDDTQSEESELSGEEDQGFDSMSSHESDEECKSGQNLPIKKKSTKKAILEQQRKEKLA